jgi:hypothetical protein
VIPYLFELSYSAYEFNSKTTNVIDLTTQMSTMSCDSNDADWAFCLADMIRVSLRVFLENYLVTNQNLLQTIISMIDDSNAHKILRTELMMVVFPTKIHCRTTEISIDAVADRVFDQNVLIIISNLLFVAC